MPDDLMQSSSKPTRADAVKNHQNLLEIAQTLFDEQGVESVTMTAIAEAAGVGKGTLYRHFPNKSELCHALIDQEMRDLQERTFRRLRTAGSPYEHLHWFLEQAARFVHHNSDLLCEASNHTAISTLQHPAHLWWRQTIAGLLSRMDIAGDIDYITDMLYIMLDVQTIRFQLEAHGYDINRIVSGIQSTLGLLTQNS